jgi:hypothetical protein
MPISPSGFAAVVPPGDAFGGADAGLVRVSPSAGWSRPTAGALAG